VSNTKNNSLRLLISIKVILKREIAYSLGEISTKVILSQKNQEPI